MEIIIIVALVGLAGFWFYNRKKHESAEVSDHSAVEVPYKVETPTPVVEVKEPVTSVIEKVEPVEAVVAEPAPVEAVVAEPAPVVKKTRRKRTPKAETPVEAVKKPRKPRSKKV